MRRIKSAQTGTEYLIITAVVVVLGLLVVSILGKIPGIGSKSGRSTELISAQTQDIGILSIVTTLFGTSLILRNNLAYTVALNNITLNDFTCHVNLWDGEGTGIFPSLTKKLLPGEEFGVTCLGARYTVDGDTSGTVSDDVYDTGWDVGTKPAYLGNLVSKSLGDEVIFTISFDYQNTEIGSYYTTPEIILTSDIAGARGYK